MNSIFLDSLEYDIERLERINKLIDTIPEAARKKANTKLRKVDSLVISPSQCLDRIASKYLHVLPVSIRVFLHGIGATKTSGSSILSYLLFEKRFCQELISLGYHDAMEKASEIETFMMND